MVRFSTQRLVNILSISIFIIFSSFTFAQNSDARPVFVMHSNQAQDSPTAVWLTSVYTELFRRIDVPVRFLFLPNQRANASAQTGEIDGQFTRIYEYERLFKDQLRINVPVVKLSTVAYARAAEPIYLTAGWSSFYDRKLRTDYVRGIVLSELNLTKWVKPDYLTASTDIHEGLMKLKHDRTDIFVHGNIAVEPYLQKDEYKNQIISAGLMDVTLLYPYIHAKHFDIAPHMERALAEIQNEGLLLKYCIEAFGKEQELFCRSIQPLD